MRQNYLTGKENFFIRMYFYLTNGLIIINNFRNLILGIFAVYVVLKLTNPIWLIVMFLGSLPVLVLVGHYTIHRMNKVNEWLSVKFSTHYQKQNFNNVEKQVKLLGEINKKLK